MQRQPEAKPCLSCGTTGGWIDPRCYRPGRTHGLCNACHQRSRYAAWREANPIPEQPHFAPHPAPLPERVELTRPRYALPWGAPHTFAWQAACAWEQQPVEQRWPTYAPRAERNAA